MPGVQPGRSCRRRFLMEDNQQIKEAEIDLREVIAAVWAKMYLVILAAVIFGGLIYVFTKFFVTPMYTSNTKVYILNRTSQNSEIVNTADLNSSTYLTQDYLQLVTARPVMQEVIDELGLGMTTSRLAATISVTNPADTRYIVINVTHEDPAMAQAIADAVRVSSAEYITKIMAIQAVNTVEEADLPVSPSSPSVRRDTFLGAVLGAMLAVILIVIRFMLNDTIKDSEDVERYLGLSVLGVIPKEDDAMETSRTRKSKKRKAKRK